MKCLCSYKKKWVYFLIDERLSMAITAINQGWSKKQNFERRKNPFKEKHVFPGVDFQILTYRQSQLIKNLWTSIFSHMQATLHEGLCVCWSVNPSVCLLFTLFFTMEFKPKSDLTSINAPAQCTQLILSCLQTCLIHVKCSYFLGIKKRLKFWWQYLGQILINFKKL